VGQALRHPVGHAHTPPPSPGRRHLETGAARARQRRASNTLANHPVGSGSCADPVSIAKGQNVVSPAVRCTPGGYVCQSPRITGNHPGCARLPQPWAGCRDRSHPAWIHPARRPSWARENLVLPDSRLSLPMPPLVSPFAWCLSPQISQSTPGMCSIHTRDGAPGKRIFSSMRSGRCTATAMAVMDTGRRPRRPASVAVWSFWESASLPKSALHCPNQPA
jgi:hypothetical protein